MANPELKPLTADTWVKVATEVFGGTVTTANTTPKFYLFDYRISGDPAPSNDNTAIQFKENTVPIGSSSAIDVYIKAVGADGGVIVAI